MWRPSLVLSSLHCSAPSSCDVPGALFTSLQCTIIMWRRPWCSLHFTAVLQCTTIIMWRPWCSLHFTAVLQTILSLSLSISNIDLPQPSCLPLVHHHHQQRPKPKISYSADENVKINLFFLNFYSFPFSKIGKKRNLYIRWNHLGFGVKPLSFHWSICYDVDWLIRCHPISHWLNCKMS